MQEFSDLAFTLCRSRPSKTQPKPAPASDRSLSLTLEKRPPSPPLEDLQVVDLLDAALDAGQITEEQYRSNIKITFLTGHENTQQLLNSAFYVLGLPGRGQTFQGRLRAEVLATNTALPSADVLNAMPLLTSVVYELLRRYPAVSQLINRVTLTNAVLGGNIKIPQHTWVGWNSYGTHVDRRNWGDDAMEFEPARWGATVAEMNAKVRRDCVAGRYIPFNAHSRKCLGQGFALLEMKIVLFELVRRTRWVVDPGYELKLTSVCFALFVMALWLANALKGRHSCSTKVSGDFRRSGVQDRTPGFSYVRYVGRGSPYIE